MARRRKPASRFTALLLGACLALAVDAAVNESPPGDYNAFYERAAAFFSEGDLEAAVVELKNALQRNPGHVPSRVLLGRAHLRAGDASAAEKELTLARRYGADEALILVPLGNALLLQRKHEEILERVRSLDFSHDANAEVMSIRGQAYLELGQSAEAERAFRAAALAAPAHPEPLLGLASVLLAREQPEEAERVIDEAGRLAPEDAEVWFRKAQARLRAGDAETAMALLDRTVERRPGHQRARLARARLRLQLGDNEGARADADHVLSKLPGDAHAALISAQANARLGDAEQAQAAFAVAAERIGLIDPDFMWRNPVALALAAKISFVRRDFEKVNFYLTRYLNLRPDVSPTVRKLLGRARLETGNLSQAIDVLEPVARAYPEDPEALVLLGDAYLRSKRYVQAARVFEQAAQIAAQSPWVRTRLALSRMGTGRTVEALSSLEAAFALDSGSMRAGLLLAFVQLRRGEVEAAGETAQALAERHPANPVAENLTGVVLRASGRFEEARAAFVRTLELEPGFEPALFNLADLELRHGNAEGAAAYYQQILAGNPGSARALIGLSDLELAAGRTYEAIALLEKAIALAPDAIQPYVRLVDYQLSVNRIADALRTAQTLAERHPENATVLEEFARAQIAGGRREEAVNTLRNASRYAGYDGSVLLRIGHAQISAGDHEGAEWSFTKAAETDLRDEANLALVRLQLQTRNLDKALELASELRSKEPENPVPHLLYAEVLARHGRFQESEDAYERSLEIGPTTEAVVGLFEVMVTVGERDRALERLERWVERNPSDLRAKRALGLGYIAANRLDPALAIHEELDQVIEDDPLLLNNLGRIYQLKKDPRARRYAERAVELAPNWAIGLDTLGWIHVTEGRPEDGLPLLREAHARAAQNPMIRYHLAAALGQLGREREAVAQLDYLLANAGDLAWIDDVRKLRESLEAK